MRMTYVSRVTGTVSRGHICSNNIIFGEHRKKTFIFTL
jgi:hypothetical protein